MSIQCVKPNPHRKSNLFIRITCNGSNIKRLLDTLHQKVENDLFECIDDVSQNTDAIWFYEFAWGKKHIQIKTDYWHTHNICTTCNTIQTSMLASTTKKGNPMRGQNYEASINTPFRGMWQNLWQRNCRMFYVYLFCTYFVSANEKRNGGWLFRLLKMCVWCETVSLLLTFYVHSSCYVFVV